MTSVGLSSFTPFPPSLRFVSRSFSYWMHSRSHKGLSMAAICYMMALAMVLLLSAVMLRFLRLIRGPAATRNFGRDVPLNVCVVLGSGGHTSEMMRVIRALSPDIWRSNRPFYLISSTDTHSANIATEFENRHNRRCCRLYTIPRAREVGQGYLHSIFTTLYALWKSLFIIISEKPDVFLVNGPGVCVPVVAAALLVMAFSPSFFYRRPAIAFIESFTCVTRISLSGRLLISFCDVFTVHWRPLYEASRRGRLGKTGCLFYVGVDDGAENTSLPLMGHLQEKQDDCANDSEAIALVTVGSTQFNSLIEAFDNEEVLRALSKRGITRLLVQKGMSSYSTRVHSAHGVTVEAFAYRANLFETIKRSMLVISHAGAGTILETLDCRKPLIVVPNRALMSDHQLELAEVLSAENYLYCVQVWDICKKLGSLDFNTLRVFPGINTRAMREALLQIFNAEGSLYTERSTLESKEKATAIATTGGKKGDGSIITSVSF